MRSSKEFKRSGHTLIELMVVMGIITILAYVAIPIFKGYSEDGRIDELKATLLKAATAQEKHFASTGQYAALSSSLSNSGYPTPPNNKMTLHTGLIFQHNVGMSFWVAGNYDVNPDVTEAYNECWVYFGSVLGTSDSNNFVRLYKETGAISTDTSGISHCPTLDQVCK